MPVALTLYHGHVLDVLRALPDQSVHMIITSPPYFGLRSYEGIEPQQWGTWCGQLGLEPSLDLYVEHIVEIFREAKRVLRDDGTLWLNMGDSYSGSGKGQMGDGSHSKEHGSKQGTNKGTLVGGLPVTRATIVALGAVSGGRHQVQGATSIRKGRTNAEAQRNDHLKGAVAIMVSQRQPSRTEGPNVPAGWTTRNESLRMGQIGALGAKNLTGTPWRVAFALQADGWILRNDIIWHKPNPMPGSQTDRFTTSHEYLFFFSKRQRYFFDLEAVREPLAAPEGPWGKRKPRRGVDTNGGNQAAGDDTSRLDKRTPRDVWTIPTQAFPEAHFATFPVKLVEPPIKAGTSEYGVCATCGAPWRRIVETSYSNPGNRTTNGPRSVENKAITPGFDQRLEKHTETTGWQASCACNAERIPATVLDPFCGSGTSMLVARDLGRSCIGIELSGIYSEMIARRLEPSPIEVRPIQAQTAFTAQKGWQTMAITLSGRDLKQLASLATLARADFAPPTLMLYTDGGRLLRGYYQGSYGAAGTSIVSTEAGPSLDPLRILLQARPFADLAATYQSDDTITLSLLERDGAPVALRLKTKTSTHQLACVVDDESLILPMLPDQRFRLSAAAFAADTALLASVDARNTGQADQPHGVQLRFTPATEKLPAAILHTLTWNGVSALLMTRLKAENRDHPAASCTLSAADLELALKLFTYNTDDDGLIAASLSNEGLLLWNEFTWVRCLALNITWPVLPVKPDPAAAKITIGADCCRQAANLAATFRTSPDAALVLDIEPQDDAVVLATSPSEAGHFSTEVLASGPLDRRHRYNAADLTLAARLGPAGSAFDLEIGQQTLVRYGQRVLALAERVS